MSADATPMPCLDPPCLVALICNQAGSCRHRQIDSAKSYEVAIAAKREAMLAQRKEADHG